MSLICIFEYHSLLYEITMNKYLKFFLILFGALLSCFLIFIGIVYFSFNFNDMCGTEVEKTEISPNKKQKIIIFSVNCGAISDFSTHISIEDSNYNPTNDDIGNIFRADSDHHKAKMDGNIIKVNAKWKTNDSIEIEYSKNSRVFEDLKEFKGIHITYKEMNN